MGILASKVLTTAKSNLQWGWLLDQGSIAYLTELAWHVLVSLRILDLYTVMFS